MIETNWWERRGYAIALILLAAVPLLWPTVPPLIDLPGHIGRYRVQLDLAASPALQHFYGFEWRLVGNLGVDLLIMPLAKLFGLELGVKLIAIAVPCLTVAGFLAIAHEVHGKLQPTTVFALPLAYSFPFQYGFINFALAMALAMLSFALWLRLRPHPRVRIALFVAVGMALWTCHTYGWAALCVLAAGAQLYARRDEGRSWLGTLGRAFLDCLPLAPPFLFMVFWRSGGHDVFTGDWFNMLQKLVYFAMVLRDRWVFFDLASLIVLLVVLVAAFREKTMGFSRMLSFAALLLAAAYLVIPRVVFGSAYADMRLIPFVIAIALLAIRFTGGSKRNLGIIALCALAFYGVRLSAGTISFWQYDKSHTGELAALDHIPQNARVIALVGRPCGIEWHQSRLDHLSSMALVRRHAFVNDQWAVPGAQLLTVRYPAAAPFNEDPSQFVIARQCTKLAGADAPPTMVIDDALSAIPRQAFDYVWLIQPPPHSPASLAGLTPVWRNGNSVLFKISR